MNSKSEFLSHLRLSSETVRDWPAWKTDMWTKSSVQEKPKESCTPSAPTGNFLLQHLGQRHKVK